jgi:hypothetical protein
MIISVQTKTECDGVGRWANTITLLQCSGHMFYITVIQKLNLSFLTMSVSNSSRKIAQLSIHTVTALSMPCQGSGGRPAAGFSRLRPEFNGRPVYVGYVVDRVTLGQIFLRLRRLSPVSIISPTKVPYSFIYHRHYIISATDSVVKQHTKNTKATVPNC